MTGQFTTAKTSGCANVSSSSSRAKKACEWDGGHPGLTIWNLLNYTRIENAKMRKARVFIMWLWYVQLLGEQNRYELEWAVMINPPELPMRDVRTAVHDGALPLSGVPRVFCARGQTQFWRPHPSRSWQHRCEEWVWNKGALKADLALQSPAA